MLEVTTSSVVGDAIADNYSQSRLKGVSLYTWTGRYERERERFGRMERE